MEEINKKICNLCGIKPQIVQDYELNDIELYPDFYEPKNFIKLMELPFTKDLTVGWYIQTPQDGTFLTWGDRNTFLNRLINVLRYTELRRVNLMRKAIRNAKWEY